MIFNSWKKDLKPYFVFGLISFLFLPFGHLSSQTLPSSGSVVRVHKTEKGWELLVDDKPYLVKGLCFEPSKVGESSDDATWRDWMEVDDNHNGRNDYAYDSYVDKNGNNRRDPDEPLVGDFQLMKEMGANTIRIYHHPSANPDIQALYSDSSAQLLYNHAPNKALLQDLYETYGLRVAMGDLVGAYTVGTGADFSCGTDYNDPDQRRRMTLLVEDMIHEFRDEPYILMWILGNENTNTSGTHTNAAQNPEAYGKFVNQLARRIHDLDPNHPVCLCEYDEPKLKSLLPFIPDVDILGINSYRSLGFGTLWKSYARAADKPILLTEFGVSTPKIVNGQLDEDHHAKIIQIGWEDIEAHSAGGSKTPNVAIGGFVFEWMDNWWQDGEPWNQNMGPGWNKEICGVVSQGSGSDSPYLRHLKKIYFSLQKIWTAG